MGRSAAKRIAVLLFMAVLLSVPAYAETAVTTPAKGVNLRTGPGTEYEVILTIPYNAAVQVTGARGGWYEVFYEGTSGYASASYLRFITDSATSPGSGTIPSGTSAIGTSTVSIFSGNTGTSSGTAVSSVPSPAPSSVTAGAAGGSRTGTVTGDYVRFRSGPSVSYSIISTLRKDTPVTVLASYGEWSKCTVNGNTGFISSAYISGGNGISGSSAAGSTVSIFLNTADNAGSSFSESSGGKSVSIFQNGSSAGAAAGTTGAGSSVIFSAPVPAPTPEVSAISIKPITRTLGYITGNNVRFRSGPSTSCEIIGEFQYGNSVYIDGRSGEWVYVTADGKSGFVSGKYVSEGTYSPMDTEASSKTENHSPSSADVSSSSQAAQTAQTSPGTENAETARMSAASAQLTPFTSVTGQQIADLALSLVGTKYTWAGNSPEEGFDCSGLVYYVYKQYGITLTRTAAEQAANGVAVDPSELRPGDVLCFYSGYNYIGHAGIYIGSGQFVHAATSKTGVIVTDLSGYYSEKGYVARRIIT